MEFLTSEKWKQALASGFNSLQNVKEEINNLNVFPVPDGDTGSNMCSTTEAAMESIRNVKNQSIGLVAQKFSKGALMGARGNSGVILSQIFKGFAQAFQNKDKVNVIDIVNAFKFAKEFCYKSVISPVEGTILTVTSDISQNLMKTVTLSNTIEQTFEKAVGFAQESVKNTPNLLPVLKEVGVVDSGGEGLSRILVGILSFLHGKPVLNQKTNTTLKKDGVFSRKEGHKGEFGYCTEFVIELKTNKPFDKSGFQSALEKMESKSIVIVQDEEILKVHNHTKTPGKVLSFAQKYGEFLKIKSENMALQVNESKNYDNSSSNNFIENKESNDKIRIAVVSCNIGNGIISKMKSLGANFIIEGGQTMNPSPKDFIAAIKKISVKNVIILPNNPNIILAAQQIATTISDKNIYIITTKTQMEGVAAMMSFDQSIPIKDNIDNMKEAVEGVKTGQVTKSTKTTTIMGIKVNKGKFLAIANNKILGSYSSKITAATKICDNLITEDSEILGVYYGDNCTLADAEEVSSYVESNFDVETEICDGGQPLYNFLISVE